MVIVNGTCGAACAAGPVDQATCRVVGCTEWQRARVEPASGRAGSGFVSVWASQKPVKASDPESVLNQLRGRPRPNAHCASGLFCQEPTVHSSPLRPTGALVEMEDVAHNIWGSIETRQADFVARSICGMITHGGCQPGLWCGSCCLSRLGRRLRHIVCEV